jgi:hypothetical protein
MDELTTLRTLAACTTVLAAAMVAANVNRCRLCNLHYRFPRLDGGWLVRKQNIPSDPECDPSFN